MSDILLFQLIYAACILKSALFDSLRRVLLLRQG
jgi:hypothetical protein